MHNLILYIHFSELTPQYNYTNLCNIDCECESISLSPVCDIDGNPYYSACHAGCRSVNISDVDDHEMVCLYSRFYITLCRHICFDRGYVVTLIIFQHFTSCRCIKNGTIVKRDWCKDDCGQMIVIYFALVIIAGIIGGLAVIPGVLIILRYGPITSNYLVNFLFLQCCTAGASVDIVRLFGISC